MTEPLASFHADLVEEFRRRLREARAALLRTLAATDEELATLEAHQPGAVGEDGARATAADVLERLEGRERHGLDEISDAEARLEAGSFGLCQRCGRPIPLARLRAMPTARFCVTCQSREEGR
ncbi:MAG TPA: TraR/DksA family transcriptional regulator [Methylomirabilota bacterium]|nr:TraR/DksA family transcriptional regulator [Methylomirabilota bacterium]